MRVGFKSEHLEMDGKPMGGTTYGTGFAIGWQAGPLGRGTERRAPNGAFVEDVIDAARDRIDYYQQTAFACDENRRALEYLTLALEALDNRTKEREHRGVEGTHSR